MKDVILFSFCWQQAISRGSMPFSEKGQKMTLLTACNFTWRIPSTEWMNQCCVLCRLLCNLKHTGYFILHNRNLYKLFLNVSKLFLTTLILTCYWWLESPVTTHTKDQNNATSTSKASKIWVTFVNAIFMLGLI